MISENLISDIGKIMVSLILILSVYLLSVKNQRKTPHYLFAAFLILTAVDLSGYFIGPFENGTIMAFKVSSVLLQMPLFFLYVLAACYFNFRLKLIHGLHALPFLIFLIIFLTLEITETNYAAFDWVSSIQYYVYIAWVFYTLISFKRIYTAHYSSNHAMTYKWLMRTTILFLVGNTFVAIRDLLDGDQVTLQYMTLLCIIFALGVICWFVLSGMHHPNLFSGVDQHLSPNPNLSNSREHRESLNRLTEYMEDEKPYLDDALTLQGLASGLGIPEKELSTLINQQVGKHFFDFVNGYRIQDAKRLLKTKSQLTVLEILYEVGFNSKSSFYTAFKKETGTTPTNYRKSTDSDSPT